MGRVLINCDLGENEPTSVTQALLQHLDAANICCGAHAGGLEKTRKTVEFALAAGVQIGAHPGIAEEGGRGKQRPRPVEFKALLCDQIHSFQEVVGQLGGNLDYVKLHGTLYHAVESDLELREIYIEFLRDLQLPAFALAGGEFSNAASHEGIAIKAEAFLDRGYLENGGLVPRNFDGAVLEEGASIQRMERWLESGLIETVEGNWIPLEADTFCVHGDSPNAETRLARIAEVLSLNEING